METVDIEAELRERLPDLDALVSAATSEQLAWVAQVITAEELPEAAHVIACQAVNDLIDLLTDCLEGSGRSAMRAARTLYEHGVNAYTVLGDPSQPDRYMAHLAQGPALLAELDPGASLLAGTARKAYQHRLTTTSRDATREFEAAVVKYGSHFRRSWTTANLRDRADTYAMGGFYDFYKLGSLVSHGSAGGSFGTRRPGQARVDNKTSHPFVTYRTGRAIALCPVAMWGGIVSHLHVMQAIEQAHPSITAAEWYQPLLELLKTWPDYQRETAALDDELWPTGMTPTPQAVIAFTQTGRTRWYLHLPSHQMLIEADEPSDMTEEERERLRQVVTEQAEQQAHMFSNDQRWLTMAVTGTSVTPKQDGSGRVQRDTSLLTGQLPTLDGSAFRRP